LFNKHATSLQKQQDNLIIGYRYRNPISKTYDNFHSCAVLSAPANTQEYTIVDVARLVVYGISFYAIQFRQIDSGVGGLVLAAIGAAFIGSFLGTRLIKKVTLRTVQLLVGAMLVLVGLGMVSGLF
jgi:hypothetical protein